MLKWPTVPGFVAAAAAVLKVVIDGLTWGEAHKLVPVAFGVKKLVLSCVVEDDKVKRHVPPLLLSGLFCARFARIFVAVSMSSTDLGFGACFPLFVWSTAVSRNPLTAPPVLMRPASELLLPVLPTLIRVSRACAKGLCCLLWLECLLRRLAAARLTVS